MPCNLPQITDKQGIHCSKYLHRAILFGTICLVMGFIDNSLTAQTNSGKRFSITIDAGHGGHDTGAPGKKSVEKNLALGIALKVGHYIESLMSDVDVHYTRKTDVFIPLYERAQIANRNKSDLFMSIHVNANKKSTPTGTSTYVMGFSRSADNLDLVMQENKAILLEKDYQTKYAGFDPTLPESYIIFNNVQNNNLNQSLEMATMVQDQLRAKAQRKDLGVHQGNLVVLWGCAKPSVLIETGFISNPEEEAFLMTENGQDIIASAIYAAFREYKESVDSRIGDISKTTPAVTKTVTEPVREEKRTVDTILKNKESVTTPAAKPQTRDESIKPAETTQKPADSSTVQNKVSQPATSGVEYRVQLLASQKRLPLNSKEFKGTPDVKEFNLDGYYKYMSKPVYTYPEALELRRRLGASFKGAFIVAFKNGERVPVTSTVSQQKN